MRIGIDCRIYGSKNTGIGRYVQNLVENLLTIDESNEYVLFVRNKENIDLTRYQDSKITIINVNIPHYSLKEQLEFPKIITNEKLDLMHFPHFNVPLFYKGKYIITIHDLIKHNFKGRATTTHSQGIYWLKYLGYKIVFKNAVKNAYGIITPSQYIKDELIRFYKIEPNKITVTYEGVDQKLSKNDLESLKMDEILKKYNIQKPYLLYVGNVYPHKNIEKLIESIKILNQELVACYNFNITLVIVCARNVFSERLRKRIALFEMADKIKITGYISDEELFLFYKQTEAFVYPTLSEGFGLPGLEAMSLGCPVICSNIPVLREVYKDCAMYFNPFDSNDIALKIKSLLTQKEIVKQMVKKGIEVSSSYSWKETARKTLNVYLGNESCVCI